MEFVLVTTTSTPDTSRSGSVMQFGDYREDEQNVAEAIALPLEQEFLQYYSESDDEDKALLEGFNALSARNRLVCHDHCTKLVIDHEIQKALQLEVGVHVSEENPWKQIRKEMLLDYLPSGNDAPIDIIEFRQKLSELDDDSLVLVGFAPAITDIEDTDTFLFYADPETAKESICLIQRLEAFEKQRVNKTIYKYARPWKSLGSEIEVDLQVEKKRSQRMEVEIQRLYASNRAPLSLSFRFADDVRDGYVELIPKHKNLNVVMRNRVSVAIQSAAQRIESEQQTDPTFPSNAWSQYSYELPIDPKQPIEFTEEANKIVENISCDENESEEEKEIDFIGPSDAMKELLRVLDFNQIDMYRDDYERIAQKAIKQYVKPVITEKFCFVDPKRCRDRFIDAFAWHPTLSGIFVASYSFKTLTTYLQDEKTTGEELKKKSVMFPNPVLLWSFDDTLYPKLILETPREVTCLSFCPYDANVLIGGLVTGQLIIWDLKNCLHRVEHPEALSDKQAKNREKLYSFMAWSKYVENLQPNIVYPTAISHYELSQKKRITTIKWLNRKHSIATTGLIQESVKPNEFYRHFVTASLDGTVSFWDLDFVNIDISPAEIKRSDTKRKLSMRIVPDQPVSPYEKLNGIFRPTYVVTCEQPISSLIFDEGLFRFEAVCEVDENHFDKRVQFKAIPEQQEKASNRLLISSLLGSIHTFIWEGFLYKEGKPEKAKQIETFATIHNGPVLMVERNPFMSDVILSSGEKVFAVWNESNQLVPIFWRRRKTNITCAQWSSTRVSLFFLACYQGAIELWELLTRTDDACISHESGATVITVITQHRLSLPIDILMIGDQKSNIRAFILPSVISQQHPEDQDKFKRFIEAELKRKETFGEWQQKHLERTEENSEDLKYLNREESGRTLEIHTQQQTDKDAKIKDEKRHSSTVVKSKSAVKQTKPKRTYDYSERMRRKWEERQAKRRLKALLELKRYDPEQIKNDIKPEMDRIAYNEQKKLAIEESLRKIPDEINEIRAKLIPPKDVDQEAERLEFINTNVDKMVLSGIDGFQYDAMQSDLDAKLNASKGDVFEMDWHELVQNAEIMRSKMNKTIFEKKRKVFVAKSIQIGNQTVE